MAAGLAPHDALALVGASALAPYLQGLPLRLLVEHGPYGSPGLRIEPASGAPVCPGGSSQEAQAAAGEPGAPGQGSCHEAGGTGVEKTLIGHEVAFLARSARAGALPLTARAVFLALARLVPDPSHPQLLVANPYRLWSDVDPALPADPIRVLGAAQSAEPGGALLAVLLQPGCHRVLPQATDAECQAVRSDDVYVEVPEYGPALVRELLAHPSWLGLLNLDLFTRSRDELAVSPLNEVIPAAASVLSGTYPAACSLYLYVSTSDLAAQPVLGNAVFRYRQLIEAGAFDGPNAALVSSQELQDRLQSP